MKEIPGRFDLRIELLNEIDGQIDHGLVSVRSSFLEKATDR
jgi:hypothetical protein